jgi:N-methylhydantoinase A/oxoprolinase/acetone carboxylase beta subunit
MSFALGIDTGGTFTDAVLLNAARGVVAASKSLTTRFDLAQGISASLDGLPQALLAQVDLVSLSTTLTTNSVVEGKGAPVCALLVGYDAQQIKTSGLGDLLGLDAIESLAGGHDAGGLPLCALDEAACRAAIAKHAGRVSAFAISATFAVRNPAHENQLRAWVQQHCDTPVTCGHELASSLGAPRRALTAALNARMISHVKTLIDSVQRTLAARQIDAPLMLVKGDGSLINVHSALQRPVSTVLSGPAASVMGACALSGLDNAIVADMGGTTTDIAVVRGGLPALSFDGAMVGNWRPMIEAVKVYAIGLGGDSEVRLQGGEGLTIGPRRVLPLSLLVHQHPKLLAVLERQQTESPHASQMRFAQALSADSAHLSRLNDSELRAWERLCQGPVDLEAANMDDRDLARAIARLERKGLAIYTGFTPSDAAHVLGMSTHWNQQAAVFAARIWARQMRHLYGLGKWPLGDAQAPSRDVVAKVTETICNKLIEAGLNDAGQMNENSAGKVAALLTTMALARHGAAASAQALSGVQRVQQLANVKPGITSATKPSTTLSESNISELPADAHPATLGEGATPTATPANLNDIPWQTLATPQRSTDKLAQPVFALQFAPDMPLVGVGAPAASYYPAVAQGLGVRLVVPPHADVANAVGAVLGQVTQRVHITVTQPVRGTFKVFTPDGPQDFRGLDAAIAQARTLAAQEAHTRALAAGAVDAQVVFSQEDNQVNNDIDGNVFFEATVTATAWGRPVRKVLQA